MSSLPEQDTGYSVQGKFLCHESSAAAQRSIAQPRSLQGWVPGKHPPDTAAAGRSTEPTAHGP